MTKSEYMSLLEKSLEQFDKELQREIMEDYRQHFAEGEKQGRSEEEIIEELGNIEEMIQELSEMAGKSGPDSTNSTDNSDSSALESSENNKSTAYPGNYKAIEINCDEAAIDLQPSEDGSIHVYYKNNGSDNIKHCYSFYQYEKDNVFYTGVKRKQGGRSLLERIAMTANGHKSTIRLEVKIPKGFKQLSYNTSSGNVSICGLEVGALEGNTASGNMELEGLKVNSLDFNTASGDVRVSMLEAESVSGNTASGDLKLKAMKVDRLELNTASGDMSVKAVQVWEGTFSTSSGDIAGRGLKGNEIACETASGSIAITLEAGTCRCSSSSGDIAVRSQGQDMCLDVNTVSGNISVDMESSGGVEANVAVRSGDVNVFWDGQRQTGAGKGTFRLGGGSCKVNVRSNTGDVSIAAQ